MKSFIKFMLVPACIAVAIIAFGFAPAYFRQKSTAQNLQIIRDHMNSHGKIVDYYGEINVKSMDDIRLYVTDDEVKLEFGSVLLKWSMKEFLKPETINALKTIGIECFKDEETGKLRMYYNDEEIERWVS